jgi:hypothetical protein
MNIEYRIQETEAVKGKTNQKSKIQPIGPLGRNRWKSLERREGNLKKQTQFISY